MWENSLIKACYGRQSELLQLLHDEQTRREFAFESFLVPTGSPLRAHPDGEGVSVGENRFPLSIDNMAALMPNVRKQVEACRRRKYICERWMNVVELLKGNDEDVRQQRRWTGS